MPTKRGVLIPALVGCLIIGGAAFQTWQFEKTAVTLQTNEDRLARQFSALEMAVSDMRAAQAGYVAAGQGPEFWFERVDEVTTQIEEVLTERQRVGHPDAVAPLAAAQKQLEALRVSDRRARNYVGNEQRLLASDVIFVESIEILGRLNTEVATARDVEIQANRREATTIRQYQAGLAGGAMVLLLGLILMAGRRGAPEVVAVAEPVAPPAVVAPPAETVQPVKTTSSDLKVAEAADVCVDLARLLDGRDLPALLARASSAIGAKGLVLWVIDDAKENLQPSLSHGYSDRMVQRLGTLAVNADNVTSVACRTMQAQVLPGALAVPLIGTSGCVGVLAAEVSAPYNTIATLAVARVIAAQLSAVISPLPSAAATVATPAANG
jgi:hypothetical protein